jgi:hypothetical protein
MLTNIKIIVSTSSALLLSLNLISFPAHAQNIPIPSTWQGEITGQIHNQRFTLPVVIVLKPPISYEQNPLHLMIGSDPADAIGSLMLISALSFNTSSGNVTLQYLSVQVQENQIIATLNNQHTQESAAANQFTAPCFSDGGVVGCLMPTEPYLFTVGTTMILNFNGNQLIGQIQGNGTSIMGMSDIFELPYQGEFSAVRIE